MRTIAPVTLALAVALAPVGAARATPGRRVRGEAYVRVDSRAPSGNDVRFVTTLPPRPWETLRRVDLPAPTVTRALRLPDGSVVVGLINSNLVYVSPTGNTLGTVRADGRLTERVAVGADGMVYAVTHNWSLQSFAPDLSARATWTLPSGVEGSPLVRRDGSVVALTRTGAGAGEVTVLSPGGDPRFVRPLLGAQLTGASLLPDDTVAVGLSGVLALLGPDDVLRRVAIPPGVRHIGATDDGGIFLTTDAQVLFANARGSVRTSAGIPQAPLWAAAIGRGRLAVALLGPPHEMWIFDANGTVLARVAVPSESSPPLVDPTGAMLIVSRGGDVVAFEADGAERWRIALHQNVRLPAAPLSQHGVALATEGSTLVYLQ